MTHGFKRAAELWRQGREGAAAGGGTQSHKRLRVEAGLSPARVLRQASAAGERESSSRGSARRPEGRRCVGKARLPLPVWMAAGDSSALTWQAPRAA